MGDTGSAHITQYTKRRRAVVSADQISDDSETGQPEMLLGRYRVLARCGHGGFAPYARVGTRVSNAELQ